MTDELTGGESSPPRGGGGGGVGLPGVYVLPRDDDLGSSDEVKVFKDEGEDEGCLEGLDGFNASFSEELQASLYFCAPIFSPERPFLL